MKTKEQISAALLEALQDYRRGAITFWEVRKIVAEIADATDHTCVQRALNNWLHEDRNSEDLAMLILAWFALGYQAATEDNNE